MVAIEKSEILVVSRQGFDALAAMSQLTHVDLTHVAAERLADDATREQLLHPDGRPEQD